MIERVLIAGSGGHGIVLMGKLLATAALKTIEHVTYLPSYGAEVRGGSSHCYVTFSSNEIASPLPDKFDSVLLMNQESYERYKNKALAAHLTILNSSLCTSTAHKDHFVHIAATEMANIIGTTRIANFIMLGAYLAHRNLLPLENVEKTVTKLLEKRGKELLDMNLQALRTGLTALDPSK